MKKLKVEGAEVSITADDQHFKERIGERIRMIQREAGYKDEDMARILNITDSSYRHMIHGRRNFNIIHLEQICRTFHINGNFLIYGDHSEGILYERKGKRAEDSTELQKALKFLAKTLEMSSLKKEDLRECLYILEKIIRSIRENWILQL